MKTFAELAPQSAVLVESIERLQILTRSELETLIYSWKFCAVGEAHGGNARYAHTCPACRQFAIRFSDYAHLTWQRYYQYARPDSKHWREYRLELFNLVMKYKYDNTDLTKLKEDFAAHFNEAHPK